MAKINKKTRIKGLPAKLQLNQKDAATGSYPTKIRIASDNRTGKSPLRFDDMVTQTFSTETVYYPSLIPITSVDLNSELTSSISASALPRKGVEDQYIRFTVSGAQNLQPFRDNDQPAVDGKSAGNLFYATGSRAEDAGEGLSSPLWSKTKIEIPINVPATVEIQTYVSGAYVTDGNLQTVKQGVNFPMSYYNFSTNLWEGVGLGIPYSHLTQSYNLGTPALMATDPFKNHFMMGFSPSPIAVIPNLVSAVRAWNNVVSGVFEWQASAGTPISNFGFPFHPKFHATSSQALPLNRHISTPFLVEKVYIELSASFVWEAETFTTASFLGTTDTEVITSITQSLVPAVINNIFIMNQRENAKFNEVQRQENNIFDPSSPLNDILVIANVPTASYVSNTDNKIYVDTSRDIVTFGGITSFAANMPASNSVRGGTTLFFTGAPTEYNNPTKLLTRDFKFTSSIEAHNDISSLSWNGIIKLELPTKSLSRIDRVDMFHDNVFGLFSASEELGVHTTYADTKLSHGGRNGLGITRTSGRSKTNSITSIQPTSTFANTTSARKENILVEYSKHFKYNPYLFLPTDSLILGWQQPIPSVSYPTGSNASASRFGKNIWDDRVVTRIKFHPHPGSKIILYGSQVAEGKEHHDTLNQETTSNVVHEIIG